MAEDLVARIQRELEERMEELRGAVEERDRLQADLRALDAVADPPVAFGPPVLGEPLAGSPEPRAAPVWPAVVGEPLGVLEPAVACEAVAPESAVVADLPPVDPGPPSHVVRCPGRREPLRKRTVSSKVARLMHAPRRPALERSGIARLGEHAG